ncbi:hypothetical protein BD413DRAFT_592733 [Trametes elegans]|nr:hypothetical protein BD413DRAFT_592733 [Trametes elegans]
MHHNEQQDAKLLPSHVRDSARLRHGRVGRALRVFVAAALSLAVVQYLRVYTDLASSSPWGVEVPLGAQEYLDKCQLLDVKPGPPEDFNTRTQSDRFVPGTTATLIKSCMVTFCSTRASSFAALSHDSDIGLLYDRSCMDDGSD